RSLRRISGRHRWQDEWVAEQANRAGKVIEAARSRFPLLDQVFELGPARLNFFRRWRAGEVTKALEIMIHQVAAAMDGEGNRQKGFLTTFHAGWGDRVAKKRAEQSEPPQQLPSLPSVDKRPAAKAVPSPAPAERSFRDPETGEEFVEVDIGDG